jgi:hypothetical protein
MYGSKGITTAALVAALLTAVAGPPMAGARAGGTAAAREHALASARRALLRGSDLRSWTTSPAPKHVPVLTCPSFNPDLSGARPLASASSQTFGQSASGPFTSQVAYVFATPVRAELFWRRVVTPRLAVCVAGSLSAGSTRSVRFRVTHRRRLSLPRIGDRDAAYRVTGTATSGGQTVDVVLDFLIVGRGSGVSSLSFTSFFSPAPRRLELRLARLVARRLSPPPAGAAAAAAPSPPTDEWWPHAKTDKWTYTWTDSAYNTSGTQEKVSVVSETGSCGWELEWTGMGSETGSDIGSICFENTDGGITNTTWQSSAPPANMPILCPWTTDPSNGQPCANSLSSALFNVSWGDRYPVLSEPVLDGAQWGGNGVGGAYGDVSSQNEFLGVRTVRTPAFPHGVDAVAESSSITAQGDLGDPYGSGTRTTYWVYGVGPVKIVFVHSGGANPPLTVVNLDSTNLKPLRMPPLQDYFPLTEGMKSTYQWTNRKHLPQPEIEKVSIAAAENRTAQFDVQSLKGPIRAAGAYDFTVRNDGVIDQGAEVRHAYLVKFPRLGHGLYFSTPLDLMEFGLDPIVPSYPVAGTKWRTDRSSVDYRTFGVTGWSTVIGLRTVRVPAGTFRALEIKSVLRQPGHRFASGVRYEWFAPGRGLVKLVFDHGDGSVSDVVLVS